MLKIRLGNNEKNVTKGAYNEFYEHLGYEIVNENKKPFEKSLGEEKEVESRNEFKEEKDKVRKENYSRK